uniref:Uncharacterized protein n=1 Tax=Aliivibrio wodanis TaxID=80852 RepID=A0A5Q4ZX34_9GAMM|nr:hypothetical protein AW0309160_01454 [Aliivibrio wodanis]
MAVEKLTGPRLYQLIFLLVVLISAFTWRTITYTSQSDNEKVDNLSIICNITQSPCEINIDNNQVIIDVKERPITQNSEMILVISGLQMPLKVEAQGTEMNMGILKFSHQSESSDSIMYSAFLPKCKHNEMKWTIDISSGKNKLSVLFNSKK